MRYVATRGARGREATAQPPRSSTVKARKRLKGAPRLTRGCHAAKKVTGRKRHILVDTLGLLLNVVVHSADMQDRDGALLVLDRRTRRFFPFIKFIFADAGTRGRRPGRHRQDRHLEADDRPARNELVASSHASRTLIVERTLGLDQPHRHLAATFSALRRSTAWFLRLAMIRIMLPNDLTNPTFAPELLNFLDRLLDAEFCCAASVLPDDTCAIAGSVRGKPLVSGHPAPRTTAEFWRLRWLGGRARGSMFHFRRLLAEQQPELEQPPHRVRSFLHCDVRSSKRAVRECRLDNPLSCRIGANPKIYRRLTADDLSPCLTTTSRAISFQSGNPEVRCSSEGLMTQLNWGMWVADRTGFELAIVPALSKVLGLAIVLLTGLGTSGGRNRSGH